MNIDELKQRLARFTADDVGAEIYFILNKGNGSTLMFADIDGVAQENLKNQFIDFIKESIVENNALSLLNLSATDERKDVIYRYDLKETPKELNLLDKILHDSNIPTFSFNTESMSNIRGLLIKMGVDEHQIALYKKHYPISLIKKDNLFSRTLHPRANRLVELDSDMIRINRKFEFFQIDGNIFIIELESLEKFFGFTEIISREASKGIDAIKKSGLLENAEDLRKQLDDISFSRKLSKVIADSPVLNVVPNEVVIDFVESHPQLKGKLKTNKSRTKLELHTKKSRTLFVKLLNDDYLTSELTEIFYESLAKDSLSK